MNMSHLNQNSQDYDNLHKTIAVLSKRCEQYQDDNVSLKLKVSELEGELSDERQKHQIKYDMSIDMLRNNMSGQMMDYKLKYEEELMNFKQEKYKQTVEI